MQKGLSGFFVRIAGALLFLLAANGAASAGPKALSADDLTQIYQLYAEYSLAIDTGNGPARAATFTKDGLFKSYISKHVAEHMDTLIARTNKYPQKKIPDAAMMHIQMTIHVTPTADGANGSCYALFPHKDAKSGKYGFSGGFYTDTLVKTAEGWKFKTREVFIAGRDY